ncbi:MAG: ChaB family protein [Micropruina sp.]|nr:ChaB family protein [Micropruina sp.]
MPKTSKRGKPIKGELPTPVQRSDEHARATFAKTYDAAMEQYGDEGRATATAYASLNHSYEKVGDHWEAKDEPGPSDARAERGGLNDQESAGGVDANATKQHLLDLARRLDVKGRSTMTKAELVEALQKANDRATAKARED